MTTTQGNKPELMLKAVIEKAIKKGWDYLPLPIEVVPYENGNNRYRIYLTYDDDGTIEKISFDMKEILFSHSFAKAYWGEDEVDSYGDSYKEHKQKVKDRMHYPYDYKWSSLDLRWGYHLKGAVLSENPLLYYFERL